MAPRKIIVVSFWVLMASVSSATAENFRQQGWREFPRKVELLKESYKGNYERAAVWRETYVAPNHRFVYRVGEGKKSTCYGEWLIEFAWYEVSVNDGCK
jgi:hypothetical protein